MRGQFFFLNYIREQKNFEGSVSMVEANYEQKTQQIYKELREKFGKYTITKKEACEFLGMSRPTFNQKVETGYIKLNLNSKGIGTKTHISLSAFAEALAKIGNENKVD